MPKYKNAYPDTILHGITKRATRHLLEPKGQCGRPSILLCHHHFAHGIWSAFQLKVTIGQTSAIVFYCWSVYLLFDALSWIKIIHYNSFNWKQWYFWSSSNSIKYVSGLPFIHFLFCDKHNEYSLWTLADHLHLSWLATITKFGVLPIYLSKKNINDVLR